MKKLFAVLLTGLLLCAMVFAAVEQPVIYDKIDFTFHPTFARFDAMGQAGVSNPSKLGSFYVNPSLLPVIRGMALVVPSVGVTVYNVQPIMADEQAMNNFYAMIKGDSSAALPFFTKYLENLGTGHNQVTKVDAGFGVQLGVFGLGTDIQVKVHTLNEGTSIASQSVIPELNAAQTLAFGLEFLNTRELTLSAGVSVHGVYKAYFKGIAGSKALDLINSDDAQAVLMWQTPVMAGWAVPIDAGVTLGLANDSLLLSVTANNLNGTYHMKSYSGLGDVINTLSPGGVPEPEGHVSNESVAFEVKTPWTLNFGATFAPDVIFHPVVTADLIDMYEMVKEFNKENFRASDLLFHLNAGAEVSVLGFLKVRAGINRGFLSVGTGIWLPFMQIDAAYGWQEFGEGLGDKTVDAFTIRFSIGYDK